MTFAPLLLYIGYIFFPRVGEYSLLMNSLIRFPMSFADPNDALQSLQQYLGSLQTRAFCDSTKRSMRTYLHSYLLFCQYFQFNPFPVSKPMYLLYLVFLSRSLSSYRSVVNYLGISTHINRSFGTSLAFLQDYDVYLAKRAVRRIMGDYVARKEPITVEILVQLFSKFDFNNHLHVRMLALFLVAFFSFLRISNLVPLALLRITHTKTIQFRERQLEIPLPCIPGSPLCPVTALKQYLASVQLPPRSPLFVCKTQDAYSPILAHQYNAFIKASLSAIGFNPAHYSSHSFRRGGATFAFSRDAPTAFIKAQGDCKSDAYLVYLTLSTANKFRILNSITSRLSPTL